MSNRLISIDVGGTFTDCCVRDGDRLVVAKAPTTPYDLSEGFMSALAEAADQLGVSRQELLAETAGLRYSTTMAMNKLIERKGPRLALFTTAGVEDTIFIGKGSQWQDGLVVREKKRIPFVDKPAPLLPRELVVGVRERVDSAGRVVRPLDEEDLRRQLASLVDRGVRGFVVSLLWAHLNPVHELRIKEIIEEEYPGHYLGAMPVVLSHQVLPKKGEYARTMTTLLNAYLHQSMVEELSRVYDRVRKAGYRGSLKMVHNTGGMADVFSTTAVQTFNGGPVAGLIGSAYVAKLYGFNNVIVSDMGGTSFDMGLVVEGSTQLYDFMPVIDRWLVGVTLLKTQSIGAGGGSIAWIDRATGQLQVGPQSAGSLPGPACYDLGGEEPTVTDADLVLGYLNPATYYGGKMPLSRERSVEAIRRRVADPLKVTVEEAALMIKRVVDGNMGNAIFKETALKGFDPRDFVLFSYGGAGATHCAGYMEHVSPRKALIFPYSSVFCALGSCVMNTVRVYEQSRHLGLKEPGRDAFCLDPEEFNRVVRSLQERAFQDLRIEGANPGEVIYELELDARFTSQLHVLRMKSPVQTVRGNADAETLYKSFLEQYAVAISTLGINRQAGVDIESFVLRATVVEPKLNLPAHALTRSDPSAAQTGTRPAYWAEWHDFRPTPIFALGLLQPGNVVEGPAIVESPYTTLVVPPGRTFHIDQYRNGILE